MTKNTKTIKGIVATAVFAGLITIAYGSLGTCAQDPNDDMCVNPNSACSSDSGRGVCKTIVNQVLDHTVIYCDCFIH